MGFEFANRVESDPHVFFYCFPFYLVLENALKFSAINVQSSTKKEADLYHQFSFGSHLSQF